MSNPSVFTIPAELPIAQYRDQTAQLLSTHPVLIVAGETGSGKTTQLPKILWKQNFAHRGIVACTEPRRVAAISVAERVAAELNCPLGNLVGYQVRFAEKVSAQTKIKFITDGVLLAQTRRDPQLRAYSALMIDEAHERTLNIDFLLGIIKRLLPQRPELKILISSATLDTEKFAAFFPAAPVLKIEGRGYPVKINYALADSGDETTEDLEIVPLISTAVKKLWNEQGAADTLIFVSGEQEIREVCEQLAKIPLPRCEILPLYGRMPAEQQRAIFFPRDLPRLIVATNVAETSLTVPRVHFVIDAGMARIKRYQPRSQIELLPIEKISQASAQQRAGRCGRVAPGVCVRLYSENDFNSREPFTPPEILRSSLASVILQMQSLKLGAIENFPFIDPPPRALIKSGYEELQEIGALDLEKNITVLGKQLAKLPVTPRYGKILTRAAESGVLADALTIVAILEIGDPRLRPAEQKDTADATHRQFADQFSDFRAFLHLWKKVETARTELSGNKFHQFCRDNFLNWRKLREWRDTREQLASLIREYWNNPSFNLETAPPTCATPTASKKKSGLPQPELHCCLLSGLLGRVGAWHEEEKIYRGTRGSVFHLHPASGIHGKPPLIMAAEIVATSRVFARTAAAIELEWLENEAAPLLKRSYQDPFFDAEFGCVRALMNATLFGLPVIKNRQIHYGVVEPTMAREVLIREGLVNGKARCNLPFFAANQKLLRTIRDREQKLRRRDLAISDAALFNFYDARLPAEIHTIAALEKFALAEQVAGRAPLLLSEQDVALEAANGLSEDLFPPVWRRGVFNFALSYKFSPGDPEDGVSCAIPAGALAGLNAAEFDWLVPGLLGEKIAQLLNGLPRSRRKELSPLNETLAEILPYLHEIFPLANREKSASAPDLLTTLAQVIEKTLGIRVAATDFFPENLPPFLRMNFRILDRDGSVLNSGRDLEKLQIAMAANAQKNFIQAPKQKFERGGVVEWDFAFPETIALAGGAIGYPALRDCDHCVALILCATAEQAAQLTRKGLRRLLFIALTKQLGKIEKSLVISATARRYFSALKGEKMETQIFAVTADELLNRYARTPRSPMDFTELTDFFRREFYPLAYSLSSDISATLEKSTALNGKILGNYPTAKKISFTDLQRHFHALIHPQLITVSGAKFIPRLPRYLDGVELRLKKLNENLTRDEKRVREITPFWDFCENQFAKLRAEKGKNNPKNEMEKIAALRELRWLLEDFRLLLFAQEIPSFSSISIDKIREKIAAIK